ncbi:MAG: ATP-binding protein [Bacteroidales bacterium]
MASKHYYFYVITGISIIGITSFSAACLLFNLNNQFFAYFFIFLVIIETAVFVKFLNKINRKIATFFNAVHNQDTSIHLPENPGSRIISDIYAGMEKTVNVFQSVKMESQFREKLFLTMIEHSTTGFISIDEFGDFEIMNETARRLLGVEYTSNMERLRKSAPELYETIVTLKPGESKSCRLTRSGFSAIVQVASSTITFKDKKLTLVSLLDIQNEIDARELESWQKLIRILNHEIMNSIAPITSASKSLSNILTKKEGIFVSDEINKKVIRDVTNCLEVIDTMSNGLSYFVENYRKLSKIPEPIIQEIEIRKWTGSLQQILAEYINSSGVSFEINVNEHIKMFRADERLLNQVVINLVKNAAEAPYFTTKKEIKINISQSLKGKTEIEVWNNGEPINKENMDKIFVPFFTTKSDGAGIGLYVSKQIVNLHNGSLTMVSNNDSGTSFKILL